MPRRESPLHSETPQGTLDMLVLRVLVMGPAHGHTIAHTIERGSVLQVEHGSLFPALQRLETRGWIASFWGSAGDNRRARYYCLTSAGRKHLIVESTGWEHVPLVHVYVGLSIALALAVRPGAAMAQRAPTLEITIEDRSLGGVELATARARVSSIFRYAGIRVVWTGRAAVGVAETGTHSITLVVISGADADETFAGHRDQLGVAIPSVSRVYVHYDRVRALALHYRTPPGWFLGLVIAHEVAHVVRPDAGHAESGLMGATLSPEATPMFTAQEAQSLRARLHDGMTVAGLDAR